MRSTPLARSTSPCSEIRFANRAQATVEAAFLLPTFLALVALAVQPVCVLYTRSVMESAASQTARLMTTWGEEDLDACRAFALRRLGAVPDVSIFHEGGPLAWDIELAPASSGGSVRVRIEGRLRLLPVIGVFASAMGEADGTGGRSLVSEVAYDARPAWVEGVYESWIERWG